VMHIDDDLAQRVKDTLASLDDGDVKRIKDVFTQARQEISDN